ncbi:unnamed protein product, partial [Boreogadus saida]
SAGGAYTPWCRFEPLHQLHPRGVRASSLLSSLGKQQCVMEAVAASPLGAPSLGQRGEGGFSTVRWLTVTSPRGPGGLAAILSCLETTGTEGEAC